MKSSSRTVVWYATVAALVFVARMLDRLVSGFLPINAAIVTLSVVFICLFVRPTWLNALACGLTFGVMSLLASVIFPSGFAAYFINPLVSVLPRIVVCLCALGVYKLCRMGLKGKSGFLASVAIAGIVGALVNTFTVMSMIYLFQPLYGDDETYAAVLGLVLTVNTLLEVVLPAFMTPAATLGVRKGLRIRLEEENPKKTEQTKDSGEEQL